MSSRENILKAITANKPSYIEPPIIDIKQAAMSLNETVQQFIATLESIGGKALIVEGVNLVRENLQLSRDTGAHIVNTIPLIGEVNDEITAATDASTLQTVDKAYIGATLGIAENGAVWIFESQMKNRLLPFICQHLVVCLDINKIVPDMHEAYRQIDIAKEGYGVFLAGPSKTADIEQSLVIGAHGARSLLVYLIALVV
ncbi:MAG: LUD domain-containing protein [Ferruginibacter sp.]